MFAIKVEDSDPWAETFGFSAQKTMYGGKHVAKGDTIFVFIERTVARVRHVWLPVVATLVVGVSLGLPLFLYMRQRCLDASTV